MIEGITLGEIDLINSYSVLKPAAQREIKDYLHYLLKKQYQIEVKNAVFQNKLVHNLFHSLLFLVEKEDFEIELINRRINQIKDLYYNTFSQVHSRYCELVPELDSNETVREFGRQGFKNIESALNTGNLTLIRLEIIDFHLSYCKLGNKKELRQFVAV